MPYSYRGLTAEVDGEVVGIAGVYHGATLEAFSTLTFDTRQNLRLVVKTVHQYRKLLSHYDKPVYATPDPDRPTADKFLEHVGFIKDEDGKYLWQC